MCGLLLPGWLGLSGLAQAQAVPAPTGAVQGRVICSDTQQPARLAHVVLQPLVDLQSPVLDPKATSYRQEGLFHLQTVGLDGGFTIPAVPPGLYYVIVEEEGYVSPLALFTREQLNHPDEAMLRRISRYMTPISVTAGHVTQVETSLIRGASISGRVYYEDGNPAMGVGVRLLVKDEKGKWKEARTNQLASHTSDYTNDQGMFRFSGLPAGSYLVQASLELNNVVLNHIFAEYGSTSYEDGYRLRILSGGVFRTRDAKPIKLEEGESASAADVEVPLSKLASLSGTVLHPGASTPVNAATLTLVYADTNDGVATAHVNSDDGSFRFDYVPTGNYVLKASKIEDVQRIEVPNCKECIPPTHTESKRLLSYGDVSQPVELHGDQSGLVLHAKPAAQTQALNP